MGGSFTLNQDVFFVESKEGNEGWRVRKLIPEQLQFDVVQKCHELNGCFGVKKYLVILKNACEFPRMEKLIKKVIMNL